MGYARKHLISLQDTPYYHCIARCVRRCWLWGVDEYAGRDYSHRKQWVLDRLSHLCSIFAVDVCAYAVMSNHYHLVLHVDAWRAREWRKQEVVERWTRLFQAPQLVKRWQSGEALEADRHAAELIIEGWRHRLYDVSWFMRCLNEHLARLANAEDRCTGRFWEGRFRSQALLDDAGLLVAMAYVDLNPIRAGIAATPEESEFTSIAERIRQVRQGTALEKEASARVALRLFNDEMEEPEQRRAALPFSLRDYLLLVDRSGRVIRSDKRDYPDPEQPAILKRLDIDSDSWDLLMSRRARILGRAMGRLDAMRLHAATLGQSWVRGLRVAAS